MPAERPLRTLRVTRSGWGSRRPSGKASEKNRATRLQVTGSPATMTENIGLIEIQAHSEEQRDDLVEQLLADPAARPDRAAVLS